MKTYIIYKHTSKTSSKSYIGVSKHTIEYRFNEHCKDARHGSTNHFHKAIRKYGEDDFISDVLGNHLTEEVAFNDEILYIKEHDTFKNGYNMTEGGDRGPILSGPENGMYNRNHTTQAKKAMSDKKKLLVGEKHPHFGKTSPLKGKSYEEQFGANKAKQLKEDRSNKLTGIKRPYNTGENNPAKRVDVRKKISKSRSTPIELYGVIYKCKKNACEKLSISLYKLNKILGENK